jgi:hypothetical protein
MLANLELDILVVFFLFWLDGVQTHWTLSVLIKTNENAIFWERNAIPQYLFRRFGLDTGYLLMNVFVVSVLSGIIVFASWQEAPEILWGIIGIGLIVNLLHFYNRKFIFQNATYRKTLEELDIKQVRT